MTGEFRPSDNIDDEFYAIIEPYDQERRDPLVTDILCQAQTIQDYIRVGFIKGEAIDEAIEQLNLRLSDAGLFGQTMSVTGKLRPNITKKEWDDDAVRGYAVYGDINGLGPLRYDTNGDPYFDIADVAGTCGCFAYYSSSGIGASSDSLPVVELNVVFDPSDSLHDSKLTMRSDEEPLLIPVVPPAAKLEQQMKEDFPAVYEALQSLPSPDATLDGTYEPAPTTGDDYDEPPRLIDDGGTIRKEGGMQHVQAETYLAEAAVLGLEATEDINRVLDKMDIFRDRLYDSWAAADADRAAGQMFVDTELGPYIGGPIVFEVRGTSLHYAEVDTNVTAQEQSLVVAATLTASKQGDSLALTARRGHMKSCKLSIVPKVCDDGVTRYGIMPRMEFDDAVNRTTYTVLDEYGAPHLDIALVHKFYALLSSATQISIPRFDQLEAFMDTLVRLKRDFIEYEDLAPRLTELQALVDYQTHSSGANHIDIRTIHELFAMATGNTKLRESIARAVACILDGKFVKLQVAEAPGAPKDVLGSVAGVFTARQTELASDDVLLLEGLYGEPTHVTLGTIQGMQVLSHNHNPTGKA